MSDPHTLKQMLAGYVVYTFQPEALFSADISELVPEADGYEETVDVAEKIIAAFEPYFETDKWQVANFHGMAVIPGVDADIPEDDLELAMEMTDQMLPGKLRVYTVDEIVADHHRTEELGPFHPNWLVLEISNNPA